MANRFMQVLNEWKKNYFTRHEIVKELLPTIKLVITHGVLLKIEVWTNCESPESN